MANKDVKFSRDTAAKKTDFSRSRKPLPAEGSVRPTPKPLVSAQSKGDTTAAKDSGTRTDSARGSGQGS